MALIISNINRLTLLDELIRQVEKLLDMKVGDDSRLTSILDRLKRGNDLYSSDQKYVDNLISKYLFPVEEKDEKSSSDDALTILKNRLAKGEITAEEYDELKKKLLESSSDEDIKKKLEDVSKEMKKMRQEQGSNQNMEFNMKSKGLTLFLSIVLGFIGLQGIGHLYIRKFGKGIAFLLGPGFLIYMAVMTFIAMSSGGGNTAATNAVYVIIILPIVYYAIWIWQVVDANKLCKKYNEYVSAHGKRPW